MGMKNSIYLKTLLGMAMMYEGISHNHPTDNVEEKEYSKEPVIPPVPKGAFRYYFLNESTFCTEDQLTKGEQYIFTCIARTPQSAVKKFRVFKDKIKP